MTTTTGATLNHPAAAVIVGFIWLIAIICLGLVLAAMYTCYGVIVGAQWRYGKWARRYKGSHRSTA